MKPVHTLTIELWTVHWSCAHKGQSYLVSIFIFLQENFSLSSFETFLKSGVHLSLQADTLSHLSYHYSTTKHQPA